MTVSSNVTKINVGDRLGDKITAGDFISFSKLNVLYHHLNVLAWIIFTVKTRGSTIMTSSVTVGAKKLYITLMSGLLGPQEDSYLNQN